jgi:hypothetical protein
MSRASDLFQRLEAGGLAALDELLAEHEPESLFVDFKRADSDGAGSRLADSDNKNLSKGISGFANAEGGLLIWGVDCRRDPVTGNEVAAKHALVDAAGFRTKLESAVSRETIPPHPGVRMLHIQEASADPGGYVIVHIPKSEIGPLRSTKSHHYHVRTGSDFSIVSHDVLAGMFGRAPQPKVFPNYLSHPARLSERRDSVVLAFGVVACNIGAVLAAKPYLTIWFGDFPTKQIHANTPHPEWFTLRRGVMPGFSVVTHDGVDMAPGAVDHLCDIVMNVPAGFARPIRLKGTVGALNTVPQHFSVTVSVESIRTAAERAATGESLQSSEFMAFEPPLS